MSEKEQLVEDLHLKIRQTNDQMNLDAIPHSDVFLPQMAGFFGLELADIKNIITILKESHKILTIEIVKENKGKDIKRVEGYIDANIQNIRKLKNFFQSRLMDEYEKQFKRRLGVHQISKEIFHGSQHLINSPIGQLANKAIMLEEYEHLVEKEYDQFNENWSNEKLSEIIRETDIKVAVPKEEVSEEKVIRRAIDSEEYDEYENQTSQKSLKKILQIYGIDFFYRVNLRKYNFDIIIQAIETREIIRKADLRILKDMLQTLRNRFDQDPKLEEHIDEIYNLDRLVSRAIHASNY